MAFDLATHRGYDSDLLHVTGDVSKASVASIFGLGAPISVCTRQVLEAIPAGDTPV